MSGKGTSSTGSYGWVTMVSSFKIILLYIYNFLFLLYITDMYIYIHICVLPICMFTLCN